MIAEKIMTTEIFTVAPENTILDIVKIMLDRGISCVPVVDDERRLMGVVTSGDIVLKLRGYVKQEADDDWEKLLKKECKVYGFSAYEVMSDEIISIGPDCPVDEMADIMLNNKINNLVVLKNGKLVGLVGRINLLRFFAESNSCAGCSDIQ